MKKLSLFVIICSIGFWSCSSEEELTPEPTPDVTAVLSIAPPSVVESDGGAVLEYIVKASPSNFSKAVEFTYSVSGITAEPNVDFQAASGSNKIDVGQTQIIISVDILNDDVREIDEFVNLEISNLKNASLSASSIVGTITDNDPIALEDQSGYQSQSSYYGFKLLWEEEFSGSELDPETYNYELGDGCPDICGWGNDELQFYTDQTENIALTDDKLVISAVQSDVLSFESARITTKDKMSFQFGRVDIRAKLPVGQGLWPAIWMLGNNIDDAGWPACGEIDIMELVGHQPTSVHGTAHWGEAGQQSTFRTATYSKGQDFSEAFHVFTLVWELNKMTWYVDDTKFHTLSRSDIGSAQWRFNQEFFFIFNVAVGGRWPGNPDETTVFPQTMEIDYVRVFQPG